MSDATSSPAQVLADHGQRPEPYRKGVLHMAELPLAEDRNAAYPAVAAAANRDHAAHPDPGTVNLARDERHLAFGAGPRGCRGMHLARLEMRVALEEWHRRIPRYRLAPGASARVSWPAPLIGADDLLLIFPPGGGEAGRD